MQVQQQQLDVPLMSQPELLWLPPQQVHVPLMVQAGLMWMPSLQEQLAGELSLVAMVMQWTPALDVLGALRLVQAWEGAQKGGGRWGRQKQQMEWVQGQLLGVCGLHWAAPGGQMLVEDPLLVPRRLAQLQVSAFHVGKLPFGVWVAMGGQLPL